MISLVRQCLRRPRGAPSSSSARHVTQFLQEGKRQKQGHKAIHVDFMLAYDRSHRRRVSFSPVRNVP
jgi:hypothetical protein